MTANVEPSQRRTLMSMIWRIYVRMIRVLMGFIFSVVLIFIGVLFVNYVVLSTPKDHAYRNLRAFPFARMA